MLKLENYVRFSSIEGSGSNPRRNFIENYSSSRFRFLATAGRCSPRTHPEDNPILSQQVHWKFSGYLLRFAGVSIGPWQSSSQSKKLSSKSSNSPENYKMVNLTLENSHTLTWMNITFSIVPDCVGVEFFIAISACFPSRHNSLGSPLQCDELPGKRRFYCYICFDKNFE